MEQPGEGSEQGLLERLGNALVPDAGASEPDEVVEASAEAQVEQQQSDEQPEDSVEADEGLVEIEHDGKQYRVPQELKNAFMARAKFDQTQQELRSLQRQAQSVLEQQQMRAQFDQFVSEDRERLSQINAQIKAYKGVDWTSLSTEDYIRYKGALDNLKDQAGELEKGIQGKEAQFQQHVGQAKRQAAANAYEFIGRHVKGFAPDSEVERSVAMYAANNGLPTEAFASGALTFPGLAVMAYKAMQFDQLQTSKPQALQKAKAAPPVVKPGSVSQGTTNAQIQYKQARSQLKKSGDVKDLARVLAMRMK